MTKNKTKIVVVGIILIAFVTTIGISYAIWQMTLQQTDKNIITTGCFQIEFQDKNPINLESAYPISNEEGKSLEPYEFTITNTCNSYAFYQINLEILDTTTLENLGFLKVMLDDYSCLLKENEIVTKTLENAKLSYKLEAGYLDANASKTFSLRLWMDEDTPTSEEFMNKLFESKITIISSYITEFDREGPVVDFVVNREDNKVIVDASASTDNDKIKYYYYSKDGENYIRTTNNIYMFEEKEINYGIGTTSLIELEQNTVNEVFVKIEDEYGNQSEVKSIIVGDMLYDETVDNNLRYVGASPNNYVHFNDELWRIIGVMNNIEDENGNKDTKLKLTKSSVFTNKAWNISKTNEWKNSSLKIELNENYFQNLKDSELIDNILWPLGSPNHEINTQQKYIQERNGNACGDDTWTGKIALMYLSDYGYATSGGTNAKRKTCLAASLPIWSDNSLKDCVDNDWIYNSNYHQWFLSPSSEDCTYASHTTTFGYGSFNLVTSSNNHAISPTLYLKSNVKIVSGNGSELSPFELSEK